MIGNSLPLIAMTFILSGSLSAQSSERNDAFRMDHPLGSDSGAPAIQDFKARLAEGKVYLSWQVLNQRQDGVYFILRSVNSGPFALAGFVKGVGVPIKDPIAYYFTDKDGLSGEVVYRLIHVAEADLNLQKVEASFAWADLESTLVLGAQ